MLSKSPNTGFISNDVYTIQNSSKHLENLKSRIPWQKYKNSKRLVCSLGVSYSYSGHTAIGHSFNLYPPLKKLIDSINSILGTNYNSALLNWYPANTKCGIGSHKDDEPEIVKGSSVLSISLGASINFYLTSNDGKEQIKVQLNDGDIFLMGNNCQLYYKHHIPYSIMPSNRISITLREFITTT